MENISQSWLSRCGPPNDVHIQKFKRDAQLVYYSRAGDICHYIPIVKIYDNNNNKQILT